MLFLFLQPLQLKEKFSQPFYDLNESDPQDLALPYFILFYFLITLHIWSPINVSIFNLNLLTFNSSLRYERLLIMKFSMLFIHTSKYT